MSRLPRSLRIAIIIAAPLGLGLLLWLLSSVAGWLPDAVIYVRISTGVLALLLGLLGTLLAAVAAGLLLRGQRRAQAQLAAVQNQAAERRRQFLQRLDHELKNPLTILQIEAANLAPAEAAAADRTGAQRLHAQIGRLHDLVLQLRKLAELETHVLAHETVDLEALLAELLAEFQHAEGAERQWSLNVPQVPWRLPPVQGDADLLYLALRNVLANAVKFTQVGDSIQLRAIEDGRAVRVEVADSGPGIPPDEQSLVWDDLFRGQGARGTPGSGLGLALTRAIIERHNGQVALRSRLGAGTVVSLIIPLGV